MRCDRCGGEKSRDEFGTTYGRMSEGVTYGPCLCDRFDELNEMHTINEGLSKALDEERRNSSESDELRVAAKRLAEGRHPFYAPLAGKLERLGIIRRDTNGKYEVAP